ncbi:MAG TPA: SpoIID/LytB domain-containing protein [Bacilli bacterium]|nr:SpoIID/LytB domain-containing protein [Bacilli bacterium]
MFDEEDFNEEEETLDYEDEEVAPEEESFPVSSSKKNNGSSLSQLKHSAGNGSKKDADNLNGVIDKNKTRNTINKINTMTTGKKTEEEKPEEQKTGKEKAEDKVIDKVADEGLKKLETMGIKGKLAAAAIKATGSEEIIKQHIKQDLKKLKKAKRMQIIMTILPYVLSLLLILLVIAVVMMQMTMVVGKINDALIGASTTIEKMSNLMSGNGWNTEEEVFFKTLESEYNDSKRYIEDDGYIDISLIAATIHYNSLTDISVYDTNEGTTDTSIDDTQSTDSLFGEFINAENVKNFYYVANYKLGSLTTLIPGDRKLIGHMVNVEYSLEFGSLSDAWLGWKNYAHLVAGDALDLANISATKMLEVLNPIFGLYKTYKTIVTDYENNSNNADTKFEYQVRNVYYEAKELVESMDNMFSQIGCDYDSNTGEWSLNPAKVFEDVFFPYPKVTMTLDDDKYYDYLVEVYIPGTFFSDNKNVSDSEIAIMAKEIFSQRDSYKYLFGEIDAKMPKGCGACSYDVAGFNTGTNIYKLDSSMKLDNVKVRLMECNNGSKPIDGEGLVDFEKYVLGVTYAENGGAPAEALKVQAIAARSYALVRAKSRSKLKEEDGQIILEMRNCTNDQVYCDPDQGCYANNKNTGTTVHSGTAAYSSDQVKPALSTDSNIRSAVSEVEGVLALDSDNNIIYTPYVSSAQNSWNDSANAGKDYTEILLEHYNGSVSALSGSNCTNRCANGDYTSWKQFGEPWSDIHLGTSSETIHSAGCLVTSISIQLARAGVNVLIPSIDPGTVVTFLNSNGGFVSGGNFVWASISTLAPTFQYQGGAQKTGLCGNSKFANADLVQQMINQGCYVVAEVKSCKKGQHWVAVDRVENGEVYMMDPASSNTSLFSTYTNISRLQCYKVIK